MAWRFVTHACGHQERINVDGPYVVVEQRVRNAERVSCPACIGIASRQRNRLDGFCELWGSKSQCDRAEPIRRRTLSQVDVHARHARIEDRDAFAELRKQVLRMNDAAWESFADREWPSANDSHDADDSFRSCRRRPRPIEVRASRDQEIARRASAAKCRCRT